MKKKQAGKAYELIKYVEIGNKKKTFSNFLIQKKKHK